ncbi:MAG: hypothetical protein EP341_11365 [Sphingomonadales bacterium]|nr:MAG: hypothetical protein EP341_11365 [Sphingomonadales bacterium]
MSLITMRDKNRQPLNPSCLMAFRRICGVCKHFEGEDMRARGRCCLLQESTAGTSDARDCEDWERKNAAP